MSTGDTMDLAYIEQHDVVSRYNRQRLNEQELAAFEIFLIDNPAFIDTVERERMLHEAFGAHANLLDGAAADKVVRPAWFQLPRLAMAACLVLGLGIAFSMLPRAPSASLQPPVVLETLRSTAHGPIRAPGLPTLRFEVDVGPPSQAAVQSYTVMLAAANGSGTYRIAGLQADADGWLQFTLDEQTRTLAGAYTLTVQRDDAATAMTFELEFFTP